ncbi:MAG TPA: PepSY domain-containing protein [Ureibacillus sp.]|nr:PepSY domain-containing protein [Ureibacillus sp.]
MTTYTKWMYGLVVVMLGITVYIIWNIQHRFFEPTQLSAHDAAQKMESLYGGSVQSFEQKEGKFFMVLNGKGNTYDIEMDVHTGQVSKISQVSKEHVEGNEEPLKSTEEIRTLLSSQYSGGTIHSISLQQGETPKYIVQVTNNETLKMVTLDAKTGEILSEIVKEQSASNTGKVLISKEKAKQIALSKLNGSVEFIIFEESSDGGYYLIEIDAKNKEAIFQIHAISGKVLSVTNQQDSDEEDDTEEEEEHEEHSDDEED